MNPNRFVEELSNARNQSMYEFQRAVQRKNPMSLGAMEAGLQSKPGPANMSEAVLKAKERHGKLFSFEKGSSWKPHDTPVLTAWLQSRGEKK